MHDLHIGLYSHNPSQIPVYKIGFKNIFLIDILRQSIHRSSLTINNKANNSTTTIFFLSVYHNSCFLKVTNLALKMCWFACVVWNQSFSENNNSSSTVFPAPETCCSTFVWSWMTCQSLGHLSPLFPCFVVFGLGVVLVIKAFTSGFTVHETRLFPKCELVSSRSSVNLLYSELFVSTRLGRQFVFGETKQSAHLCSSDEGKLFTINHCLSPLYHCELCVIFTTGES